MNQYKFFVIFLFVITVCEIRISAQTNNSYVRQLKLKQKKVHVDGGLRRFPTSNVNGETFDLYFGVLLPKIHEPNYIGCTYGEALPAIELAIKKLQQPGGLFENFTIFVDYRETKPSSADSAVATFDLYSTQAQG